MKFLQVFIFVVVVFVFQLILFNMNFLPFRPNLLLISVIGCGLTRGVYFGVISGVLSGFFYDILFADKFGINIFFYTIFGYLVGMLREKIFSESILISVFIISVISGIHGLWFFLEKEGLYFYNLLLNVKNVIFPEILLNIVFYPIILFFINSLVVNEDYLY